MPKTGLNLLRFNQPLSWLSNFMNYPRLMLLAFGVQFLLYLETCFIVGNFSMYNDSV